MESAQLFNSWWVEQVIKNCEISMIEMFLGSNILTLFSSSFSHKGHACQKCTYKVSHECQSAFTSHTCQNTYTSHEPCMSKYTYKLWSCACQNTFTRCEVIHVKIHIQIKKSCMSKYTQSWRLMHVKNTYISHKVMLVKYLYKTSC